MKTITYSLLNGRANSNQYYKDVSVFTDLIVKEAGKELNTILKDYFLFVKSEDLEELRSGGEYLFDFLTLGTIWKNYLIEALNLTYPEYFILSRLFSLRRKYKKLKPYADKIRGIAATISLRRKFSGTKKIKTFSLKELDKLLKWMEATGEFREEVKRMLLLRKFLSAKKDDEFFYYINIILDYSSWFENESKKWFGQYTKNVINYLETDFKKHILKEDVIFCGRKEVEYHLSMVGAELMNRAFKKNFDSSGEKAVLLPACMKLLPEDKCKAKKITLDYVCTGCSPKCRINQYRLAGLEKGFEVHIIPHSSDFTRWLEKWAVGKDIGVVGVACPLNLITGGLELKSLNIPAQCVLLDYCGCKSHWDKKGIATDLNQHELLKILGSKDEVNSRELVTQ